MSAPPLVRCPVPGRPKLVRLLDWYTCGLDHLAAKLVLVPRRTECRDCALGELVARYLPLEDA